MAHFVSSGLRDDNAKTQRALPQELRAEMIRFNEQNTAQVFQKDRRKTAEIHCYCRGEVVVQLLLQLLLLYNVIINDSEFVCSQTITMKIKM